MPYYKSLSTREFAEALVEIKNPIVLMHVHPDGDTVGSAAALMVILERLGKSPRYACSDKIPGRLAFLLQGFTPAIPEEYVDADVIAVDIASRAQGGDMLSILTPIRLMLDHHEVGEPFADNLIIGGASSAGEIVMEVAQELVCMDLIKKIDAKLAYPLYAAISSDTGCFRYSNAKPSTMRRAALLIETGIDYADINHRLFNSKTPAQVHAEGIVAKKVKTDFGGRLAYATVTQKECERLGGDMELFETAIDVVRSVEKVEIAMVVKETDKKKFFKVSLRSTGHDVSKVCALFGGGGHVRAAGCTVEARDIYAAVEKIKEAIGTFIFA